MFFISEAVAQVEGELPPEPNALASMLPLILIFMIFYFLIIRPQQKKIKEHNQTIDELKKGDEIVTGGGVIGKIIKIEDNILKVEINNETAVQILKSTITGKYVKPNSKTEATKK